LRRLFPDQGRPVWGFLAALFLISENSLGRTRRCGKVDGDGTPVYKPSMQSLPTILLRPAKPTASWRDIRDLSELNSPNHGPSADGDVVQVKDHRQRFLGIGFYNSKSKIGVRLINTERVPVDENFFEQKIRAALVLRKKHVPDATSFRIVNSESDFLSGLIVDKYEDVLVLQISALGMDQRKNKSSRPWRRYSHRALFLSGATPAPENSKG